MTEAIRGVSFEGSSDVREVQVAGDRAYLQSYIEASITMPGAAPTRLAGHTLTILRKENRRWRVARDANFVMPKD